MELLLKRNEIGRNKYDLFAKLELTSEEQSRMRKADTRNTYMWEPELYSKYKEGLWAKFKGGVLAFILGTVVMLLTFKFFLFFPVALIFWLPLSKWFANQSRKGISVADIITGRTIRCKSLDKLYVKENAIKENIQKYCNAHEEMHALGEVQRIKLSSE